MSTTRLDLGVSIDELGIGKIVYARDNFAGSNKIRPWVIREIYYEDETVLANPISSKRSEFTIDIVFINGEKSFVSSEQVELHIDEIEHVALGVVY